MPDRHLLIIGSVWPEPDSSAAGSRMMQLIELFQSHNLKVTFGSTASDSEYAVDLSKHEINKANLKLNSSCFDDFIRKLNPDIVLFDRFMTEEQFGWRVAQSCPDALRILDTEDLHCLRAARQQAVRDNRKCTTADLFSDIAKREIASIWRSDLSLIISEYEMNLLSQTFGIPDFLIYHLPFMLDDVDDSRITSWPDFKSRTHFISIGNFLHEPNWDAVLHLKNDIWPLIRDRLPDVELHIYGAYPSQKVEQLHNEREGFLIKGRADSAIEVISQARILLAPLRFGAGLKGKLIEAMQCGTPSVTTHIGAEAMHDKLPWSGIIEDDARMFAEAAVKLYQTEKLWKEAQQAGVTIINTVYPKKELGEKLMKKIREVRSGLNEHRLKNFTGAMLQHHSQASTKFMSKWIEAKNKP